MQQRLMVKKLQTMISKYSRPHPFLSLYALHRRKYIFLADLIPAESKILRYFFIIYFFAFLSRIPPLTEPERFSVSWMLTVMGS